MKSIRAKTARAASLALALLIVVWPAGCGQGADDEGGDVQRRVAPKAERPAEPAGEPSREGGASPSARPEPDAPADRSSSGAAARPGDVPPHGADTPSAESRPAPAAANEPGAKPGSRDEGLDADRPEQNDPASAAGAEGADETREAGGGPNEL